MVHDAFGGDDGECSLRTLAFFLKLTSSSKVSGCPGAMPLSLNHDMTRLVTSSPFSLTESKIVSDVDLERAVS